MYRQGDILLKKIKKLPKGLKKKDKVLAYGEITGHSHQFLSQAVQVYVNDDASHQYCDVLNPAELVHEEHDPILIPKGVYEVIHQRELDLLEEIRKVVD